ncbi:hypothetical protein NLU13_8184 [Sarocladium strictum]|uniref:Enoyl reductase (ER) domain-containing protein n=1 Tax=Sarocladium strictum TaxID=5046 RepID=A0AA39L4X1_SARSR|nr:hypothetical protein NLU13_8184 [Sarocladium strictum]
MALPATQAALKIAGPGEVSLSSDTALPVLEASDVLVRVACISISPVDSKSADLSPALGATSGTEFAGVVVVLGEAVSGADNTWRTQHNMKPLQIGDRVLGGVFGNNPLRRDNGAFAEFVAVPARLVWHVPNGMDLVTSATLPAAVATVGLSLFQHMQLPMPSATASSASASSLHVASSDTAAPWVLVHGGGTATGAMAIQVLKLAGFKPVTTCSPSSSERALRLGAVKTFDYRSSECGAAVREYTRNTLALALDCITDSASMALCYEALGSAGGRYVALDSFPLRGHTRRSVVPDWVCAYTQFGGPVAWAAPYNLDARPDDRRCAESWYALAQKLLDEALIEPHPKERRSGGLAAIGEGMDEVRKGQIRGKKLVYPIAEELCAVA